MKKYLTIMVALMPFLAYPQLTIDTSSLIQADLSFEGSTATGTYDIIYGNVENKLIKPFILVEGWDPFSEQGFVNFYYQSNLYKDLFDDLNAAGYDIVYLDFDDSGDLIQRNAYLLVKLIQTINGLKQLNSTGQFESNTVMGFSLGGLISRYALSYMEANNLDHETINFISHDSPQMGANIPLSLQLLADDNFWRSLTLPSIFNFYEANPAIRQILYFDQLETKRNSFVPSPGVRFDSFQTDIYNLNPSNHGYPVVTKNISLSNGNRNLLNQNSLDGISTQRLESGDEILVVDVTVTEFLGAIVPYDYIGRADYGNWIEVEGTNVRNFPSDHTGYDVISGSFGRSFQIDVVDIENIVPVHSINEFTIQPFCFIPTLSALNINTQDVVISAFGINKEQVWENGILIVKDVNCNTPFDAVFAEADNSPHVSFSTSAQDFIKNQIGMTAGYIGFAQQTSYTTSSLTINNAEFEHVTAAVDANLSVNVNINSGGSLKVSAGESVNLGDGFHAKTGSDFSAKVGGNWEVHDVSCITVSNLSMSNSLLSKSEESTIMEEKIDYSQYVSIFSNPNSGSFEIGIDYDLNLVEQINIVNTYHELVYFNDQPEAINEVNIEKPKPGAYFVLVAIDGHLVSKQLIIE